MENQDIFQRHLLPYLSIQDVLRLKSVAKGFEAPIDDENCWKVLCERDFEISDKSAPQYNPHTKSFDELHHHKTFNKAYKQWSEWQQQTCYSIEPRHMIDSIKLWTRCRNTLRKQNLGRIVDSLAPPPSREFFEIAAKKLPSSLLAFYAVHGGQSPLTPRSSDDEFFAGLFGSYSCYDNFYSMRLIHVTKQNIESVPKSIVGMNLGNPRAFLVLDFSDNEGPDGSMYLMFSAMRCPHLVYRGGILSFFKIYVERLESKMYTPTIIHPDSPSSMGLSLFPETGDMVSVAVTNGIEVKASARWFPDPYHGPMSFGYSIRIRLLASNAENEPVSYQLVDRNWEFHYEDGTVNRVQGEGVIGKQPLFFRRHDGTSGFVDLGPAGSGETNLNATFRYQSQSGPVPGTSSRDVRKTTRAHVKGTFSFRPGSIDSPTGSTFLVTVAEFPLRVMLPFY